MKYLARKQLTRAEFSFGSRSFVAVIWILKLRRIGNFSQSLTVINWGHEWRLTHVKLSERWRRNLTIGFCTNWIKIRQSGFTKCAVLWCCDVRWKVDFTRQPPLRSSQCLHYNKELKPFQSQSCIKRRLWSLFGVLQLVSSTTAFWIQERPLLHRSIVEKLTKYVEIYAKNSQHWSIGKDQSCFMIMPDRTFNNGRSRIWMN
jgi:hypothetical protein